MLFGYQAADDGWCSGPTVLLPPSFWARDPNRAVALAGIMAIVSGAICIIAGIARLGFITELLSKPIRYGYMNGSIPIAL